MSNLNPNSYLRSTRGTWARHLVAAGALGMALAGGGFAHAADVYWSVGVHQPGVSVGISNAPPVVVAYPSYPVVVSPPVVVRPVPRVIYGPPATVVVAPAPQVIGWVPPGHRKHKHKHGHGYRWDDRHWDDRNDRWDRRDGRYR
ncbi:hypothetical protein [Hydrogenophaga aquatica]